MTRYIDADALDLMHIDQTDLPQNGCLSVVLFEDVCNAPTADVVSLEEYRRLLDAMGHVDDALREYQDKEENGDFVEVVRCKDCRSGYPEIENDNGKIEVYYYCDGDCCYHSGNDYCSDGERRG